MKTLCWKCFEDGYLQKQVKRKGTVAHCNECRIKRRCITVAELGKWLEPVLRENYLLGDEYRDFGADDGGGWVQEGGGMADIIQGVLGQSFKCDDEIVQAVCRAENYDARGGDIPFWDHGSNYVDRSFGMGDYMHRWQSAAHALQSQRRFFNEEVRRLFDDIFADVDNLYTRVDGKEQPVALTLSRKTVLARARACHNIGDQQAIVEAPFQRVGPPPANLARAGRMNPEGIAVLYAALQAETALAETRPPIGGDTAVIEMQTTRALRILDFQALEMAWAHEPLSYFQPDFQAQMQRRTFMADLHGLIAQPVLPSQEQEYLVSQTMAEYLAFVHAKPFDGVAFASVQHAGGRNIVLFNHDDGFPVEYVAKSLRFYRTEAVQYRHQPWSPKKSSLTHEREFSRHPVIGSAGVEDQ